MADQLNIPQVITLGDQSIYLCANDYSNGALFGSRLTKQTTQILLAYTTDALRWGYQSNQNDPTLRGTANYLIWLCGIFGVNQVNISNGGGGTIIPIDPTLTPTRLDFYVSDITPVKNGDSSVSFPNFKGFNLQFDRGNQSQAMVTDGASTYYLWNKNTGIFQVFGSANTGELFSLIPYV